LINVDPDRMPLLIDIENDALADLQSDSSCTLGKVDVEAIGVWKILDSHGLNPRSRNANIIWLQVGVIIPDDLGKGEAFANQLQDALHRNPGPGYAGLPEMNSWFDGESLFHDTSCQTQSTSEPQHRDRPQPSLE
jgi:hypothetical protein